MIIILMAGWYPNPPTETSWGRAKTTEQAPRPNGLGSTYEQTLEIIYKVGPPFDS